MKEHDMKALMGSSRHDWMTPPEVLARVREVGPIALDPCPDKGGKWVGAKRVLDDGLVVPWRSRQDEVIFCNPPYGREQKRWIRTAISESKKGCVVILLIPSRTDTKAFQELLTQCRAVCFVASRLTFYDPETLRKASSPAPFPSAVVLLGGGAEPKMRFSRAFETMGAVIELRR